jgi:predicted ATPase
MKPAAGYLLKGSAWSRKRRPPYTLLYARIQRGEAVVGERVLPPTTNLPEHTPPTAFVGRDVELAQLADRLEQWDCRLLTLAGPGGIGKTRLALQAAADQLTSFPDGVYFVPRAPLSSTEFLIPTIADALKFVFHGSEDPKTQLMTYLREKDMLLVLDNFERLLEGTELLVDILRCAPAVIILITSCQRLNMQGEWVVDVQGLQIPEGDQIAAIDDYSAGALFLQSARRVRADFAPGAAEQRAVARICRLLEGMPLAIQLSAAWVRTLSCAEIAQEIERGLGFLTAPLRDMPE